jgi:carboxylesterase
VLLYRSREDHVVDPLSAQLLKAGAVHTDIREILLEDSYHVATLDNDAPTIFAGSLEFITELAGAEASSPSGGTSVP